MSITDENHGSTPPTAGGDHDLLIEIRTIVKTVLDRLTSHDRRFDNLETRLGRAEGEILVLQSTKSAEDTTEQRNVETTRQKSNSMWLALTALGTVGGLLVTVIVLLLTHRG